jgi:hypothetical protein
MEQGDEAPTFLLATYGKEKASRPPKAVRGCLTAASEAEEKHLRTLRGNMELLALRAVWGHGGSDGMHLP